MTGPTPGDAGSSGGNGQVDTDAGASGPDSGSIQLSRGAIIAIIVVACSICIFGGVYFNMYFRQYTDMNQLHPLYYFI